MSGSRNVRLAFGTFILRRLPRAGFASSSPYSTASSRTWASRSRTMLTDRGERPPPTSCWRKSSTRRASSSAGGAVPQMAEDVLEPPLVVELGIAGQLGLPTLPPAVGGHAQRLPAVEVILSRFPPGGRLPGAALDLPHYLLARPASAPSTSPGGSCPG